MYTYLIGWSKLNKWYYGCRFAKNSNPSDLWVTYFTSSKTVKSFRKLNGEPDIIQIRKVFETSDKCRRWESIVLRRMNVVKSDKWLNKTDNEIMDRTGLNHTEETCLKMRGKRGPNKTISQKKLDAARKNGKIASDRKRGKPMPEWLIPHSRTPKNWTQEARDKQSKTKSAWWTPERRAAQSEIMKERRNR